MIQPRGKKDRHNAEPGARETASVPHDADPGEGMGRSLRFTEEERQLLAEFFILLDQMDRAQGRDVRKAA